MVFFPLKLFGSFICFSFFLLSSKCIADAVINLPENTSIPAVIVFGDSVVDTGNNNYINNTIAKANYPPYGKNFMGGKPTGRFCDGKVPPDLMAEELGIKPLLPPYLDPSLTARDLLTGVNFASGGAGYDPLTAKIASVLSLSDQLELFKDYVKRLKKIAGEEISSKILRESIIIVVAGTNDVCAYFNTPFRRPHYDALSYTKLLVSYASSFVQDLYREGARRIGVFSLPPVGCLPSQRTLSGGLERRCVDKYDQLAQLVNHKLSAKLASVNIQFPNASVVYIDIYHPTLDVIDNPKKYGFRIADKGCCGTGTIEVEALCTYTCSKVSDYVFWDSFHPTEKTYRILVHQILPKYIKDLF